MFKDHPQPKYIASKLAVSNIFCNTENRREFLNVDLSSLNYIFAIFSWKKFKDPPEIPLRFDHLFSVFTGSW